MVELLPEDGDDFISLANLIANGDTVQADTVRKVIRDKQPAKGGRDAERVRLKLGIKVHKVEELSYDKHGCALESLRIEGKNILENKHVKIGQFHTLQLELNRPFILQKELWDSLSDDVLKQASNPASRTDLVVVLMEEGLAQILLVGRSVKSTTPLAQKKSSGRGSANSSYDSALKKFFNDVVQVLLKRVDFKVVRCVVIAGPGSIAI